MRSRPGRGSCLEEEKALSRGGLEEQDALRRVRKSRRKRRSLHQIYIIFFLGVSISV